MTFYPQRDEPPPESLATRATWGVRQIIIGGGIIVGLFFLLAVVLVYPAVEAWGEGTQEVLAVQVLTAGLWDVGIVVTVYRLAHRSGGSWRTLGLQPPRQGVSFGRLAGTIVVAYFGAIALVQAYAVGLDLIGLDELLPDQQIPDEIYDHDWVLASFAVLGVTLVPFAEEIFFRGFFFGGLRRRMVFPLAAAISGAFFSLAHADPGLIIPFTGVGMILAYTYERTGTLMAPVGVHTLFNLVSFLILILVPEARGE
jgi:membrane protease YdiL (CAAX protease family)